MIQMVSDLQYNICSIFDRKALKSRDELFRLEGSIFIVDNRMKMTVHFYQDAWHAELKSLETSLDCRSLSEIALEALDNQLPAHRICTHIGDMISHHS